MLVRIIKYGETEMTRIDRNNLENLKALYGAYNTKKASEKDKKEEVQEVKGFEAKKVDANALDVLALQNQVQVTKVDTSDEATAKRLEQAFAGSGFMQALDELQGNDEDDFVQFAFANITGVNHEKLSKYLNKPLSQETTQSLANLF